MKTQRYSFLLKNKLRLTILVMIFATGIVLSVFLFTLYSLSQVRKADELNITYLSQISGSADILHEQVNALNNAVFTDFNIFRVMSQRTVDRLAEAVAVRRLKAIKSSYTYVRFVGVINPFLGRYITNAGVFTEYGFDADTLALLSGEDVRALSMARVIGKTYPLSDISDAAYTFVAKSSPHSKYLKNALTVVDINQDYLNALIGSLDSSAGQHRKLRPQQIIVFDQNGQIVSHTGQR
ncbi:MAG: hypothetical protein LBS62_05995, partial [Clostridiales bacterium]|nr:hypothetical protein [Clostridiales bacterium]